MVFEVTSPVCACACPLCGQPNHCAMEAAKHSPEPVADCWCVNVSFSPALLARVPQAAQRKACICESCARQSHADTGPSHA